MQQRTRPKFLRIFLLYFYVLFPKIVLNALPIFNISLPVIESYIGYWLYDVLKLTKRGQSPDNDKFLVESSGISHFNSIFYPSSIFRKYKSCRVWLSSYITARMMRLEDDAIA